MKTQIVTHIMPGEIDEYEGVIDNLLKCSEYLEEKDWISIYATLNLSPELIEWEKCDIDKQFFIDKFENLKQKCTWANEIIFNVIEDDSILGTTSQKREAIKEQYDQFIFLDCDIIFHPTTLKYMLETSYQVKGKYFITPQTVKLWDYTWDILVNDKFKDEQYGYERLHPPHLTFNQEVDNIEVDVTPNFKFGCGWFTLYSREILDFIGIPEWLGHYGPEDTFLMYASEIAKNKNHNIIQYLIKGIYVSENYIERENPYKEKLKMINLKQSFRDQAESNFQNELNNFNNKI